MWQFAPFFHCYVISAFPSAATSKSGLFRDFATEALSARTQAYKKNITNVFFIK
jgi:hypothetical protein